MKNSVKQNWSKKEKGGGSFNIMSIFQFYPSEPPSLSFDIQLDPHHYGELLSALTCQIDIKYELVNCTE